DVGYRSIAPLADALAVEREPGAALLDQALRDREVDHLASDGDPAAVAEIELRLPEGGRDLVLDHLDPGAVADDLVAVLDGAGAADGDLDRGVELQGVAARGGLGAAEHHPDLHPELV